MLLAVGTLRKTESNPLVLATGAATTTARGNSSVGEVVHFHFKLKRENIYKMYLGCSNKNTK